jgi:small subunit ribosomal protein S1
MDDQERPRGGGEEGQTMAALLEADTSYPNLHRGGIIEGVVVGHDRGGVIVDVGAKSEGIILPSEMHCLGPQGAASVKAGDRVLVFVIQPETTEGQILLSLDRARGEIGWRLLQEYYEQGKAFEGYITGYNRGGLLVNVEGLNAFVPLSQVASRPERGAPEATEKALSEWVGKSILLKVIELNRRRNRAILSERAALQEKRALQKDLSELAWDRTAKSPLEMFRVGDEVDVYIMKMDQEAKKIALSIRRAQPEQWEDMVAHYREGQIVAGRVTKLAPFGAFVCLDGPVEGLIHISELADRRLNHPREVVAEDDLLPVKIVRIERDRHRLSLSLRQAREKAEEEGWEFDDKGRVTRVQAEEAEAEADELAAAKVEGDLSATSSLEDEGAHATPYSPAESKGVDELAEEPTTVTAEPSLQAASEEAEAEADELAAAKVEGDLSAASSLEDEGADATPYSPAESKSVDELDEEPTTVTAEPSLQAASEESDQAGS